MIEKNNVDARPLTGAGTPASRQVHWHSTYEFAARFAADHGLVLDHTLIAGTVEWCGLPDGDARKLLSLLLGGVRDAMRLDSEQEQRAEASHDIAGDPDVDWSALAQRIAHGRGENYIERKKAS